MRISDGAREMNVRVTEYLGATYEVVDIFTTMDGQWYVSDSEFSIPQWAIDEYAIAGELGGAHHFYVRILNKEGEVDLGATVAYNSNGLQTTKKIEPKDGFANLDVYNVFYPDQGETGGWESAAVIPGNTKYLVQGGGLPYGLHVSLFAVYKPKDASNGNGNGNGNGHDMEVWIPMSNTTVHVHTNGHDFNMEVTE